MDNISMYNTYFKKCNWNFGIRILMFTEFESLALFNQPLPATHPHITTGRGTIFRLNLLPTMSEDYCTNKK